MLTYIVDLLYVKSLEEIDKHLPAHRAWLKKGYDTGLFLMSGPKEPRIGGVIIARTSNSRMLQSFIEDDPFFKEGLASYSITAFTAMPVE